MYLLPIYWVKDIQQFSEHCCSNHYSHEFHNSQHASHSLNLSERKLLSSTCIERFVTPSPPFPRHGSCEKSGAGNLSFSFGKGIRLFIFNSGSLNRQMCIQYQAVCVILKVCIWFSHYEGKWFSSCSKPNQLNIGDRPFLVLQQGHTQPHCLAVVSYMKVERREEGEKIPAQSATTMYKHTYL